MTAGIGVSLTVSISSSTNGWVTSWLDRDPGSYGHFADGVSLRKAAVGQIRPSTPVACNHATTGCQ
jgi:hypothetical protein